jgi:hypothetical protein
MAEHRWRADSGCLRMSALARGRRLTPFRRPPLRYCSDQIASFVPPCRSCRQAGATSSIQLQVPECGRFGGCSMKSAIRFRGWWPTTDPRRQALRLSNWPNLGPTHDCASKRPWTGQSRARRSYTLREAVAPSQLVGSGWCPRRSGRSWHHASSAQRESPGCSHSRRATGPRQWSPV